MLKPGEGEAPKGIQLSKEISNWDTPFPLCDHVSTYLHKCTHTPNKATCLHHFPCPGDKRHCWYKICGGSNTDSIILADIINPSTRETYIHEIRGGSNTNSITLAHLRNTL